MKIRNVTAYPISFAIPDHLNVSMGIGRAVKRDAVLVKVETQDGPTGWGEAHAGRAPGAIAQLINTTLRSLVLGYDATDVVGIWQRVYQMQLASHGMGAAAAIGLSGIDMACWDIRGKATGWPLYRLLGGQRKAIAAYAGGVSLGHQPPDELVAEAAQIVDRGYTALKLRFGDTAARDLERAEAVRNAFGSELAIMTDANTAYSVADARYVMPGLDDIGAAWLEEPFPPHDHLSYAQAARFGRTPLAAGENHYTRFEFHRVIEDRAITVLQPDLSKTGGITEAMRIAALASSWKLRVNPHTSVTGLNMAASVHFLAAVDNAGYYEADLSRFNPFREELTSQVCTVDDNGNVFPPEAPGLGVEVDEAAIARFPVIEGPGYV
ncbi:MAG: mandelate racemase/muconate lactonizing enzyme family protein [Pseudomonadota bacterium]